MAQFWRVPSELVWVFRPKISRPCNAGFCVRYSQYGIVWVSVIRNIARYVREDKADYLLLEFLAAFFLGNESY